MSNRRGPGASCPELSALGYWYPPNHRAGRSCPKCEGTLYEQRTQNGTNAMIGCRNWHVKSGSSQCHFRSYHKKLKEGFKCGVSTCQVHYASMSQAFTASLPKNSSPSSAYDDVWADDDIPGGLMSEPAVVAHSRTSSALKRLYLPASMESVQCSGTGASLSLDFREDHMQSSAPPLKKLKGHKPKNVYPDG